jgi:NTP pyrophosphatase (non-canonical NTP hydrolase)
MIMGCKGGGRRKSIEDEIEDLTAIILSIAILVDIC